MRTVKEYKTVEEVVGYEAIDGTFFKTKEECEKYENTSAGVITSRFKKLVIKEMEGLDITGEGSAFVGAGVEEDWYYALVEIKDENDLKAAQMYYEIVGYRGGKHGFDETMIGKRVIVSIGTGEYPRPKEGKRCGYDNCYVWGTIEDEIKKFEKALRKLEDINE